MTHGANAVCQLHARDRERHLAGHQPGSAILGITNGVHTPHLGRPADARRCSSGHSAPTSTRMDDEPADATGSGSASPRCPTDELWEAHQRQKLELALFARGRLRNQFARHGEAPSTLEELENVLDPSILTIGFARRFATYKRVGAAVHATSTAWRACCGTRSGRSRSSSRARPTRPTGPGQGVIQDIFGRSRSPKLRGRVFILEDYDIRDRALPGPGRRRLAQQPAPAARGVGHAAA